MEKKIHKRSQGPLVDNRAQGEHGKQNVQTENCPQHL